jgi:cell division protease FtsH
MDGFADNIGIIVIAATNRSDVLDPALLRAGRFDRQITVGLPDKVGREEILKVHARNKKFDDTVNWTQVAKRTVGFSGADLASIINDAAILTVRLKKEKISIQEIDEAIDRRIAGPAKKSKHLTELERRTVAYHEAGHAIIGLLVPESDKVQKVTIVPRGMAGGYVLSTPEDDRFLMTKGELIARITGFLGGRSSEEIFFNDISTGASNDIEQATRIARAMVVEYGMSSLGPIQYESHSGSVFLGRDYTSSQKNFSGAVANEIDREVRTIVETAHENAKKIILEHREDVELIAEALLEHETLNGEEIDYLLKNRKMPEYRKTTPDYSKPVVEEKKETSISEFNPVIVFPGDEIEENSSKEENKEEE